MTKERDKAYIMSGMTWDEVERALEKVEVALIPVGSHEQHSLHLTQNCDTARAENFTKLLAKRLYPKVIMTPVINFGLSEHHLSFPGTISLSPETLKSLAKDIIFSLKQHGLRKFVFVNGHGGNDSVLNVLLSELKREQPELEVAYVSYNDLAQEVVDEYKGEGEAVHACMIETSEIMYLAPEVLKKDKIHYDQRKDIPYRYSKYNKGPIKRTLDFAEVTEKGALGDPRKANIEIGEEMVETALNKLADFINDFLAN